MLWRHRGEAEQIRRFLLIVVPVGVQSELARTAFVGLERETRKRGSQVVGCCDLLTLSIFLLVVVKFHNSRL